MTHSKRKWRKKTKGLRFKIDSEETDEDEIFEYLELEEIEEEFDL